ncbi:hypothetical protein [Stenotrophomonas sp. Sm2017]|uniref:hypothetical protein n=1 Tax=Stenotrophomonas TaxID=40323 RepID=UPI0013D960F1|nr:hypothetical protein [Stenotrophomonas sp. Sm2017]MDQ7298012.1 hypothetical protein [Stenotrophomonas sp. Sm2017]
MERERPEYLQPIPRSRWEFPWLGLWAVLLLGMAGAGIWLHLKTSDAWNARFRAEPAPAQLTSADLAPQPEPVTDRKAALAEIRARREQAEREVKQRREEIRCIGGVAFRRIPGGWENIPGETCP